MVISLDTGKHFTIVVTELVARARVGDLAWGEEWL